MRTFWIAALAAITAIAGLAGNARADVPPADPQAIFDAARKAWAFTSYPSYANYAVAVHYTNGSATIARHYDTLEDLRRDIVFAHTFSHEENANPETPSGTNVGMLGMTMNVAQDEDPIGPLALAVTYDFGISLSERPTQVLQMGSQVNSPDRYPVIGRTGAVTKTYTVRLIELLDGGKTYHLGLTPIKDPNHNRLREMWVSAGTFITQKILISANFSKAPYTDVAWLVTFRQIDGGPYIADEKAQGPLDFGEAGSLTNVTISFENITSTSTLPAYGSVGINGDPDNGPTQFVTEP
jgi:hypothetical protein